MLFTHPFTKSSSFEIHHQGSNGTTESTTITTNKVTTVNRLSHLHHKAQQECDGEREQHNPQSRSFASPSWWSYEPVSTVASFILILFLLCLFWFIVSLLRTILYTLLFSSFCLSYILFSALSSSVLYKESCSAGRIYLYLFSCCTIYCYFCLFQLGS